MMNKFYKIIYPLTYMLYIYLLDWSICVDCSISKCCTRPRRFSNPCCKFSNPCCKFSNPCFKFVRNEDKDSPFTFVVVVAVVVAQINATNNRKVFILMVTRTVKKQPECNFLNKSDSICTVLARKYKPISVITTPFSVNAQLHLCSTVWVLSFKVISVLFQIPRKMTHHFLKWAKRAKWATYLFKTFPKIAKMRINLNFALILK